MRLCEVALEIIIIAFFRKRSCCHGRLRDLSSVEGARRLSFGFCRAIILGFENGPGPDCERCLSRTLSLPCSPRSLATATNRTRRGHRHFPPRQTEGGRRPISFFEVSVVNRHFRCPVHVRKSLYGSFLLGRLCYNSKKESDATF
jgi:hypothetical protein